VTAKAGKPAQRKSAVCPICGKPTEPAHRPFCSKRCAEIDLGRWLKGAYAVPGPRSTRLSKIEDELE